MLTAKRLREIVATLHDDVPVVLVDPGSGIIRHVESIGKVGYAETNVLLMHGDGRPSKPALALSWLPAIDVGQGMVDNSGMSH